MKFRWDKKYLYWGATAFATVSLSLLFYYMLFHGSAFQTWYGRIMAVLSPVNFGLAFAFVLTPLVNYFEKNWIIPLKKRIGKKKDKKEVSTKDNRGLSILLTFLFIFLLLYGLINMIIPQIATSINNIVNSMDTYMNNLYDWSEALIANSTTSAFGQYVYDTLTDSSGSLEDFLTNKIVPLIQPLLLDLSTNILAFVRSFWNILLGFVFAIYLLGAKERFAGQAKKIIYSIFSTRRANTLIDGLRFSGKTFNGFITGKLIDSLIIGLICFIGLTLLRIPYPILISVIIGITNIIPVFGPFIGAVPSALLILMVSPIHCLYFIIFVILLQQLDGNVIGPKILGDSTGLSGFWVLFSITVFGGLYGVFGMFIGIPTFAVMYAFVRNRVNKSLEKKQLPTNSSLYMFVDHVTDEIEFIPIVEEVETKEKTDGFFKKIVNRFKNKRNKTNSK